MSLLAVVEKIDAIRTSIPRNDDEIAEMLIREFGGVRHRIYVRIKKAIRKGNIKTLAELWGYCHKKEYIGNFPNDLYLDEFGMAVEIKKLPELDGSGDDHEEIEKYIDNLNIFDLHKFAIKFICCRNIVVIVPKKGTIKNLKELFDCFSAFKKEGFDPEIGLHRKYCCC